MPRPEAKVTESRNSLNACSYHTATQIVTHDSPHWTTHIFAVTLFVASVWLAER